MNLAVLSRDVEDAHLLAPAAAIRIDADDDRSAGLQVLALQTVDQRLRDAEAFAFDERRFAVRPLGFDGQVHVRVRPLELRDLAFDHLHFRHVEHRHAVVGECGAAEQRGGGENRSSGSQTVHWTPSKRKSNRMIVRNAGDGTQLPPPPGPRDTAAANSRNAGCRSGEAGRCPALAATFSSALAPRPISRRDRCSVRDSLLRRSLRPYATRCSPASMPG